MKLPKKIKIKEVGSRDGFQMEKTFVPTQEKIKIIDKLSGCGLQEIQYTSFVHPKAVPNMSDAVEVTNLITRNPRVLYSALVPNRRGYERAAEMGVAQVEFTISATDSHSMSNLNTTTEGSLKVLEECLKLGLTTKITIGIAVLFGCPFEGRPSFEHIAQIIDRLAALNIDEIGLSDTIGVADPKQVYEYASRLLETHPEMRYSLHVHNTHGGGIANMLAAMQAGVDSIDASIAGLGGCPFAPGASGNVATEDLVQILETMGIETGLNIDCLIETAKYTAKVVGHHDSATLRAGKMGKLHDVKSLITENNAH